MIPPARRSLGVGTKVVIWLFLALLILAGVLFATKTVKDFLGVVGSGREEPPPSPVEPAVVLPPEPVGPALSYEGFNPGNIITDEQFFNADSYTEEQIGQFIAKWNEGCRTGLDGSPCLADYTEDAPAFDPDQYCPGGFQGQAGDNAAKILWRASQGCGVNPQVLLTILQKEQGLVTASGFRLDQTRYAIAMGFACPDHSNCDSDYFGFSTQVYYAARQMKKYQYNPYDYMARSGENIEIPYSPDPACGSSVVYVENQGTANLYNYTPYQPNEQALAGYEGECAAWGNLNFFAYFNAWFGTPERAAESALTSDQSG